MTEPPGKTSPIVAAARWFKNAHFPEARDAAAWQPPANTGARIAPTIPGLLILGVATIASAFTGWIFAEGTICTGCDTTRLALSRFVLAFLPLISSVLVAAWTVMWVVDGRRPVRWWILGCILLGTWLWLGTSIHPSAS